MVGEFHDLTFDLAALFCLCGCLHGNQLSVRQGVCALNKNGGLCIFKMFLRF